jgi:hypothetical protein
MTTTTTQTSEFQIYFGHDRILDKVYFSSLAQVMEAISNNIYMFENDNFQFSENSITVEMTMYENNNDSFEKLFKIPVSKFNLMKKMNLGL